MSKVMGIYVKFSMTTYQIWSCHVILAANFKNFYFSPDSVLNFRKSYKILAKLAQEQNTYRQKNNSAYRVKFFKSYITDI